MRIRLWPIAALFLVALSLAVILTPFESQAGTRMCALRQGPDGPCTCKRDSDGPGQFSTVPRNLCKRVTKRAPKAAPVATADASVAAQGASNIETSQIPQTSAPSPPGADAAPVSGSVSAKLTSIRQRGKLLCGVNPKLLGFSVQSEAGVWSGMDVDFCRALSAAVFGDANKVDYVPIETSDRFEALKSGRVDLLARNTTWTMSRDVDLGLEFAGVLYYDGQGFLANEERGLVSAQQLSGTTVCVEAGTTSEQNMTYYFKAHDIEATVKSYPTREALLADYQSGACDAISGDHSGLSADRAAFAEPLKHTLLPEIISKEPLGPAVLDDDVQWTKVVRWTLAGLVNAEEIQLDRALASGTDALSGDAARLVEGAGLSGEKLGLSKTWLRDMIAATGHYGEIYDANIGKQSPLGLPRGINALWKKGGLVYAPPMW